MTVACDRKIHRPNLQRFPALGEKIKIPSSNDTLEGRTSHRDKRLRENCRTGLPSTAMLGIYKESSIVHSTNIY